MALILTFLMYLATALAIAIGGFYFYLKRKYNYWQERNVPCTIPKMPLGNLSTEKNILEVFKDIYDSRSENFFGFWLVYRPCLMVKDPELVRRILVQDFSVFPDHGNYSNVKDDPLSNHLFSLTGSKWRNMRAKLSPTFTSGKMKTMFPIIEEITDRMYKVLDPVAKKGGEVEIKDLVARFTTDIIASTAFGIETSSLENPDSIFRVMGKKIFQPKWSTQLRNMAAFILPDIARIFSLTQIDKDVSKFFLKLVRETIDHRKEKDIKRNDVMQNLIHMVDKGVVEDVDDKEKEGDPFTFEAAAAQAFVFFIAGQETSSGAMQLTIYELAKNQAIQDRLRKEILDELKKTGKMTYEGIFSLKYLGMVLDETQRLYPQGGLLMREASRDYKIPDTDVVIEKGTIVYVSPYGMHCDPRYFPNPEVFDPERFTDEEKAKRPNYTYLPFGEGPRFCIGQRFAQMQMRAAAFALLAKYKFEVCDRTPKKIVLDPKVFGLTPDRGVYVKITAI